MKRALCLLLVCLLSFSCLGLTASAAEMEQETTITYFEDGSYLVETIEIIQSRASGTKTGSKSKTYYGDDGTSNWKATLTGTFTYTGTSATCTASSVSVTVYDSDWYTVSKSASKSGNTATASVTMGEKLLGVTVNKMSTSSTLSCDKDGNLS